MIHTSQQLKALVRNISKGDSIKAQIIMRSYAMERFLERLSLSPYRENLILKGGVLVSAMVGLDKRSTMDVDATIKGLPLSVEQARNIVHEIAAVPMNDGLVIEIKNAFQIMDESDYSGVRVLLDAVLETMHTPLKIDFSTGDVITPREIVYPYKLMFEDRSISIMAYNLETILAEKLETLLSRGVANTRMRDFYDIYVLTASLQKEIDCSVLREALNKTGENRGSLITLNDAITILHEIEISPEMAALWKGYQNKFDYAAQIRWEDIMNSVHTLWENTH
ncbi:nucleotidyl transferase AbiEii/AbiGii toxin family protein [Ruminococcaceae bacterium OttesenSCG-928-A11]|nr:nucleotidyl transferase AbiEii/AbiGii toxin family protein [Ruminococcaceae bacterium OttesenSCG-928-A11]